MRRLALSMALFATPALAQRPKPVIQQPQPMTGVSSGTAGPKMPVLTRKTDPSSRSAHADTTDILRALSQKLRTNDVKRSAVTILGDTAWVSPTDPKFRGVVYRLERRHAWKVVDPPGG